MTLAALSPLLDRLRSVVGAGGMLTAPSDLMVYECDGYTVEKNRPEVVVFPTSTEQVVAVVQACNEAKVPFVPRGAGTSLAGGCLPVGGGVMIALTRMKRILEVNYRDRYAVVEPGVVNIWLTQPAQGPRASTTRRTLPARGRVRIGGNVATNSGGPHTLKYGVTVNHVLGVEMVLPDGQVVQTGGPAEDNPGYDLTGVIVGSEGTFGIVTQAWVRLTRNPEAYRTLLGVFESVDDATNTISDIIGAGIIPAALEMLDQPDPAGGRGGVPFRLSARRGSGADHGSGWAGGRVEQRRRAHRGDRPKEWGPRSTAGEQRGGTSAAVEVPQAGVRGRRPAGSQLLHPGRRGAANQAAAHSARDPRTSGSSIISASPMFSTPATATSTRSCSSMSAIPTQVQRVIQASNEILDECIACGGSVTGEHGIGVEKVDFMPKLFSPEDLAMMLRLRAAFNPENRCSPAKMFPTAGACIEPSKAGRRAAL